MSVIQTADCCTVYHMNYVCPHAQCLPPCTMSIICTFITCIYNSKGMLHQDRRNSTRSQNRPLPPHPEPGTPSISSIHAHLINENLSPMTPGSGANFEMQMIGGRSGMIHHSQPGGGEIFWPEASTQNFPTLSSQCLTLAVGCHPPLPRVVSPTLSPRRPRWSHPSTPTWCPTSLRLVIHVPPPLLPPTCKRCPTHADLTQRSPTPAGATHTTMWWLRAQWTSTVHPPSPPTAQTAPLATSTGNGRRLCLPR